MNVYCAMGVICLCVVCAWCVSRIHMYVYVFVYVYSMYVCLVYSVSAVLYVYLLSVRYVCMHVLYVVIYVYQCVCLHIMVCINHVFVFNACTYSVHVQYMSMCVPTCCMCACSMCLIYSVSYVCI